MGGEGRMGGGSASERWVRNKVHGKRHAERCGSRVPASHVSRVPTADLQARTAVGHLRNCGPWVSASRAQSETQRRKRKREAQRTHTTRTANVRPATHTRMGGGVTDTKARPAPQPDPNRETYTHTRGEIANTTARPAFAPALPPPKKSPSTHPTVGVGAFWGGYGHGQWP